MNLPETVSLFIRSKVCLDTVGAERHRCEDGLCNQCSFMNYFAVDESIQTSRKNSCVCEKSFSKEHNINFILDFCIS